jgi:hypothetical protein
MPEFLIEAAAPVYEEAGNQFGRTHMNLVNL